MYRHRDATHFYEAVGAFPDHHRTGTELESTLQERLASTYRLGGLGKPHFNERFTTMENYFEVGMRFEMRGNLLLAAMTFAADYVARGRIWHPIRNHGRSRFV